MITGFLEFSKRKTAFVQHGYHRYYLMTIFVTASLLVWFMVLRIPYSITPAEDLKHIPFHFIALTGLILAATISTLIATSRLIAFISIGITGFGIVLIFAYFSGIDLAITMIMVETLMVIIGAMVVYHLPKYISYSNRTSRIRDISIAALFGSLMTFLVIKTGAVTPTVKSSDYYTLASNPLAYGRNIVNVILVDFRALDTMGEVVVLIIAAIGVYALLKVNTGKGGINGQ